ncbi:MAG: hypothetical protein IIB17_01805 [Chloroflexi bacterium]|nr:hypothetical protein [Chloroflexota bacterium]
MAVRVDAQETKLTSRLRQLNDEAGNAVLYAMLVIVVGAILMSALLPFIAANLRAASASIDNTREYYTAAAGIEAVLADLIQGKNILDSGYAPPAVTLNDITAEISVGTPDTRLRKPSIQRWLDPGVSSGLNRLGPGEEWIVRLNGIQPYSVISINWAFQQPGAVYSYFVNGSFASTTRLEAQPEAPKGISSGVAGPAVVGAPSLDRVGDRAARASDHTPRN